MLFHFLFVAMYTANEMTILMMASTAALHYSVTLSTARSTTTRPSHMFIPLVITPTLCITMSSALDELHDLDHDDVEDNTIYAGITSGKEYNNGNKELMNTASEESDTTQDMNNMRNQQNERSTETSTGKLNIPDTIDRFSRAVANEIMRKFWKIKKNWQEETIQKARQKKIKKDLHTNSHRSTKNIDIQSKRRVGAWCPPDSSTSTDESDVDRTNSKAETMDKSVVPCSHEESSESIKSSSDSCTAIESGHINTNDVQPGMVVYVFPQGVNYQKDESMHPSVASQSSVTTTTSLERLKPDTDEGHNMMSDDAGSNDKASILGTRCLHEMGQHYDDNELVVQYTLLEQEPVELGNVDVHRKDFAYQPVVLTIADVNEKSSSQDHELETRIKPGGEMIEKVVTLPSPQSSWSDHGGDQQVSYRWFSWVSHISQMLHKGKTYNHDGDDGRGLVNPNAGIPESSGSHSYNYHGEQSSYQSNIYEEDGTSAFAGGSHGEIWKARRRCPANVGGDNFTSGKASSHCDDGKDLIVKRLKIEYGYAILEAGLREVYFGELLAREAESSSLFTNYIDHFFREGAKGQIELWIVFENAGPSLRSFLYTPVDTGGYVVFQHSAFWRRLRRSVAGGRQCKGCDEDESLVLFQSDESQKPPREQDGQHESNRQNNSAEAAEGRVLLREVLKQLITSVAFLNERGIVHRDVKPSNIMCKTTQTKRGRIDALRCILGDFSSGVDEFSSRNLYTNGPSSHEQTNEYAPPEVLFGSWMPFFRDNPFSYDSWSIGVVALELLLGTPNVFSVDTRTTALLTNRLKKERASSQDIQQALYLAALSQFCIYEPTQSEGKYWPLRKGDPLYDVNFVKNKCTLKDFHSALRARDPLGLGFDDDANTLLHLVWRLLDFDPLERLSASQALNHPYFVSTPHWKPIFLHTQLFSGTDVTPEQQHALEHQRLDPRVYMSSDMVSEFVCPKCGKRFDDHGSCQKHARSRRHAKFCIYDSSLLPQCLNTHSMLPHHPTSGYCDIQGRRKTIEDFHTVHLNADQQFYGVFDGHLGNLASKYAASSFYNTIEEKLSNVDESVRKFQNWQDDVTSKVIQSFEDLHDKIIEAVESSPGGVMDQSGTTATFIHVTELTVIVANVGDSRAIMSQWLTDEKGSESIAAIQLTVDHVASSKEEKIQIIERGGFVSESGGIDRVNGSLAVSRSLGDIKLAPFLSRTPHVLVMTKEEAYKRCGKSLATVKQSLPCFIILASDGLWDVMSNQEAVDLAWQVVTEHESSTAYQKAAEVLTQEAYVRGSLDNIGVCIIAVM